ncbi:hypothetical protein BV20DRAFT_967103 [Pilatotrama ljubarskyi]|nr:hypothetical protein BV20DRAFT_967103 [Pilatotrama ljubarskyi]
MPDQQERHPYLRRLDGGNDLLLRDDENYVHRFAVQQVRLYCRFDQTLRDGAYDSTKVAYPGGYDSFVSLWNRAEDFPWRFSTVAADGTIQVAGQHPSADRIAPLPPPPVAAAPRFSTSQEDAIQGLLWDLAARETRKRKRIDESRASRGANPGRTMATGAKPKRPVFGGLLDDDDELEQFDGMSKIRRRQKKAKPAQDVQPVAEPSGTRAMDDEERPADKGKAKAADEDMEDEEESNMRD